MFLRGIGGIPADWGYQVINPEVYSRRAGLDVLISEVCAWLEFTSTRLRRNLDPEETRNYSRPVSGARYGFQGAVTCTIAEHWQN
jgi:hypothetical protein